MTAISKPGRTLGRRRHRAGESNLRQWRALRRQTFRQDWRLWMTGVPIMGAELALLVMTRGLVQLFLAGATGAAVATLAFGWMVGWDAHNLPWIWGRVGEQQTEDVLNRLGPEWRIVHDIPRNPGNWDHVVVGPNGVFLLETKAYRASARVNKDRLYLGRTAFNGSAFRGSAKHLNSALTESHPGWIEPVVVIWGEFEQDVHEETGVIYIAGASLARWLLDYEPREMLSAERVARVATALENLRDRESAVA